MRAFPVSGDDTVRALLAATALAAWSGGCDLALDLGSEAQVSCADGATCPTGWVCRPEVGRCFVVAQLDTEPPRLSAQPLVAPAVGGRDALFEVTFSVSEPLLGDPAVVALGRPLGLLRHDGLHWAFGYRPTGDEAEGAAQVEIALADLAGNRADGLGGGTLTFDFSAPEVLAGSAEVDPPVARAGTLVTIRFSTSEPLGPPATVRLGEGLATVHTAAGESGTQQWEYRVRGDEPPGAVRVTARLEDAVGNVRQEASLGTVELDFAPPELSQAQIPQADLGPADVVGVVLTFDEPLAAAPVVSMLGVAPAPVELERVDVSPVTFSYFHTVQPEEDGAWALRLGPVRDLAGNEAEPAPLGAVRLDTVPPGLLGSAVELVAGGHRKAGDPVRVAFSTTEPVLEPEVRVELVGAGSVALALEEETPEGIGSRYVFGLVAREGHPEGAGQVTVQLEDRVGNRGGPWTAGPVALDLTRPVLDAASLRVSPDGPAGLGAPLEVVVTADELLASARLQASPDGLDLGEPAVSGRSARWSTSVGPRDAQGWYDLTVSVWDPAGNEATVTAPAAVAIDVQPPAVLPGAAATPAFLADGADLEVVFETDEPLSEPPRVWVGVADMALAAQPSPTRFVFGHRADRLTDPTGEALVEAELADAAGNPASVTLDRVTFDFAPPVVLNAELSLSPPTGSDRATVTRVTNGTGVRLVVSVSEALAATPTVRAARGELELDVGPGTSDDGRTFSFEVVADGLPVEESAQGPWDVLLAMEDLAGNPGTDGPLALALPFEVDTRRPSPLDPAAQRSVLLRRAPWGTEGTGGERRMVLLACPREDDGCPAEAVAAFEPGSLVVAYLAAAPEAGVRCSRVEAARGTTDTESGGLLLDLPGDAPAVCVAEWDAAGNGYAPGAAEGGLSAVERVEWTATMAGKVAGSDRESPHRYEALARFDSTLLARGTVAAVGGGPLDRVDGQVAESVGGGMWQRQGYAPARGSLEVWATVGDLARGVTVGPYWDNRGGLSTFEFDGSSVVIRQDADPEGDGDPADRVGAAVVWDALRGKTLLHGGAVARRGWSAAGDLWAWDGTSWELVAPDGVEGTPARSSHAMAHDTGRDRLVLYGGATAAQDGGTLLHTDTWEWDGVAWVRVEPEDPEGDGGPGGRLDHAMANDPGRGRVVLFGGESEVGPPPEDLWEWDGRSWARRWALAGPSPGPQGRTEPALAYDPQRRTVLMYGGERGGGCRDDLWSWDGSTWARLQPDARQEGDQPPGLQHRRLQFHSRLEAMVLTGWPCGRTTDAAWRLDGDEWRRLRPAPSSGPGWRWGAGLAQGDEGGGLTLFGGAGRGLSAGVLVTWLRGDTWVSDGEGWRQIQTEDPEGDGDPAPRIAPALVYDSGRSRLVLFGGGCSASAREPRPCGDTWEWTGTSWEELVPEDPEHDGNPAPRTGQGAAYSAAEERTVLFGGGDGAAQLDDTWTWDGQSWRRAFPATVPPARAGHALAYDAARERVVLFGGESEDGLPLGDTWEWDGDDWRQVVPDDPEDDGEPESRSGHALAYHPVRRRVVLLGGCAREPHPALGRTSCADGLWEWDGVSWERVGVDDADGDGSLLPRSGPALAYEETRQGLVQYGGLDDLGAVSSETWLWRSDAWHGPGQRWTAVVPPAALLPGTAWEEGEVRVTAAGLGEVEGQRVAGLRLWTWQAGAWSLLAERSDGPSGRSRPPLTALEWPMEDPIGSRALVYAPTGALHLALTPAGPDGTGLGRLWVDYAEVRLRYRIGAP